MLGTIGQSNKEERWCSGAFEVEERTTEQSAVRVVDWIAFVVSVLLTVVFLVLAWRVGCIISWQYQKMKRERRYGSAQACKWQPIGQIPAKPLRRDAVS